MNILAYKKSNKYYVVRTHPWHWKQFLVSAAENNNRHSPETKQNNASLCRIVKT
jgi:hypothetical protein